MFKAAAERRNNLFVQCPVALDIWTRLFWEAMVNWDNPASYVALYSGSFLVGGRRPFFGLVGWKETEESLRMGGWRSWAVHGRGFVS